MDAPPKQGPLNSLVPGAPDAASEHHHGSTAALALGALGVVYGDIGTSPLYTLAACFNAESGLERTPANVLGVLSLVFWSLTFVVVVKYLSFIMRADNRGEGGILALLALTSRNKDRSARATAFLTVFGLFGAALLYGDGVITPAISVLSAVEGLRIVTTAFDPFVVPITIVILVALFLVQKHGTERVGAVFGPAMVVWFLMLAALGVPAIARHPQVLHAVDPRHALALVTQHGVAGFLVLGSVVLCITGGEALYADMGHFGKNPIRVAWYSIVFPCLLLNYFGQGALLIERGAEVKSPFFELVPESLLVPAIFVATVATIIASQALISGAYSLTQQAVQLGFSPRVTIVHTSGKAEGQIYIPEVNDLLMIACVILVATFKASSALEAAYGIAVTGTMAITSVLFFVVARERFGWSLGKAIGVVTLFLVFDLAFFAANLTKFSHGGWFPIAVAAAVFTVMATWKQGRTLLGQFLNANVLELPLFLGEIERKPPHRVRGAAVFLTSNPNGVPPVLLHHFKHNKVLHEQIVLLSISTAHVPEIRNPRDRLESEELGHGFYRVKATFGFAQTPNVPETLDQCRAFKLLPNLSRDVSYFLGRETLVLSGTSGMAPWRKKLFAFLSRNAQSATAFFGIPPNRVVELGTQVEL
jgi:KUP system potassium uptake protein